MSVLALSAVGALAGTAINAYQRNQEKKRQERIDRYNQRIQRRDYLTQRLMSSPSYQKKQLSEAGYNPYASGDLPSIQPPSNGSALSPTPMDVSSVGDTVTSGVGSVVNSAIQSEQLQLQQQAIDVQKRQAEIEQGKLQLAQNQTDFDQNKRMLDSLLELYKDDSISKDSINKVCAKYGFEVEGQGRDARLKEKQIQATEADIKKAEAETRHIDVDREMKEFERDWQDKNMRQLYVQRGLEIDNLRANIGAISLNTERAQIAKSVEELQAEIAKVYGSIEDVPMDVRMKLIQQVRLIQMKSGYFHDKFMLIGDKEYKQFLHWMRENDKDVASAQYWQNWINTVSNAVNAGATVYGAGKIGQGVNRSLSPRSHIFVPQNYTNGANPTFVYR